MRSCGGGRSRITGMCTKGRTGRLKTSSQVNAFCSASPEAPPQRIKPGSCCKCPVSFFRPKALPEHSTGRCGRDVSRVEKPSLMVLNKQTVVPCPRPELGHTLGFLVLLFQRVGTCLFSDPQGSLMLRWGCSCRADFSQKPFLPHKWSEGRWFSVKSPRCH